MSQVIADVSATLQTLLTNALSSLPGAPLAHVHDLQGSITTNPAQLTIFLFDAAEDSSARNRPHARASLPPDVVIRKPPLALLLRYMLTPWSGDRPTDQLMLGRVMQELYDNAIVSGSALQGDLSENHASLKITQAPLSLEERSRVWHAVQKSYRLSASYEVRVVNIESQHANAVRAVANRTIDSAMPEALS